MATEWEGKGTVLVVDDTPATTDMVRTALEDAGYRVSVATSGESALRRARLVVPDLVLLDVMMPGFDGYETCRRLKADEAMRDVPVIFLSALSETVDQVKGFQAGGVDFLGKPIAPLELLARVHTHLTIDHLRRALRAANKSLEDRVAARTAELRSANAALEVEITERRRVEEELRFANTILQTQQEASPDGILVVDEHGDVLSLNRRFSTLWDIPEELLGRRVGGLLLRWVTRKVAHPADFLVRVRDIYGYRENSACEEIALANGVVLEGHSAPIFGPRGEYRGRVWYSRDITARKLAEREREVLLSGERAARAEAERAGRMKDEFLATLSHELRTPLSAVLGWSQALQKETTSDRIRHRLEVIERNARAQARIIDDLLDMSGVVSGKVRLNMGPVDLMKVIEAALESAKPAADAKSILLDSKLDAEAGPVWGDEDRLQQVVWNLLSNGIKFTPHGGAVRVVVRRSSAQVELEVSDTGIGISDEFMPYLFERFRQADASTTRRYRGLGLGLAIVRHLVEAHGGAVRASSAGEDRGATLTVTLPLQAPHAEHKPGQAMPSEILLAGSGVASEPLNLERIRVLVVDDEPDARELISRLLTDHHAEVEAAGTVTEALVMLRRRTPSVLVSDISMPDEDGYSLIRRVRQLPHELGGDVPAVALTALARAEDRDRAIQAGYQVHLTKPFEPLELVASIATLAGGAKAN